MIGLCESNLRNLASEDRWQETVVQASISIQAWRFLQEEADLKNTSTALSKRLEAMQEEGLLIAKAGLARRGAELKDLLESYRTGISMLKADYDPTVVNAKIYGCPMCRGIRELDPATPCPKCGMKLEPRIIPASSIYNTPGKASVILTAKRSPSLSTGTVAPMLIHLARAQDGEPVTLKDLLVVHTQPIHLLIVDGSLTDYHHEHPQPTGVAGDFSFSFTPRKPGSYRIFADITPTISKVQEYAVCEVPGEAAGESLSDQRVTATSVADGLRFDLQWQDGRERLPVREPVKALVQVFDQQGKPFAQLEPIMGAYAHVVAFHEDGQTVLHLHPTDATPQQPNDRGGPSFRFQFYAPKAGFYRMFVQVQVGGVSHFAPFGVAAFP